MCITKREIKNCAECGHQPNIIESFRTGLKIGCSECERYIIEAFDPASAFEAWDLINMDSKELAIYSINKIESEKRFFTEAFMIKLNKEMEVEEEARQNRKAGVN